MTVTDPCRTRRRAGRRMQVRKRNGDTEPVDVNKIVRAVRALRGRLDRRRPAAGRDQDHQRPVRRRDHRRAGPAVDPDRGRDDRRGAAVLAARRPAAGRLHRQGGPRAGHRLVQPVGQPRPRRGPDRRRDRRVRQGQRAQARRRRSTPARDRRFEYFGLRTVYDRYLLRHPATRLVIETPQYFLLRVACGLSRTPARGDRVLPADVLAGLPAELADAVQLRHPPPADVLLLPGRLAARRARTRSTTATRQVARLSKFAGGIGIALVPGPLPRRADPRHQRRTPTASCRSCARSTPRWRR